MRFLTIAGIVFYTSIVFFIGGILIIFSFNYLPIQDAINALTQYLPLTLNSRVIVGLTGLLLIIISYSFAQLILGKMQQEKTIAFANPQGQVTISLSAVEDLIKRLVRGMPEIKEIRPDVIAGKKGIAVDLRLILASEVNIPDLTSRLQDTIKNKIQETLGIEEEIFVKIHVAKIISTEEKDRKRKETDKEEPRSIPYSGYGRV
ncbi:MAG: alkaline shock response membrane anchor protein AmaP [Candidatus Omnitrophica bacterium]|nr:alkaline shock response membrane anchor protein AmaP [Candidatus Omnitrophota bacterium]MDD5654935.1 alkaline shock response membrane anchor protein AmaP [Candidatus Omnitrophota bacterium]